MLKLKTLLPLVVLSLGAVGIAQAGGDSGSDHHDQGQNWGDHNWWGGNNWWGNHHWDGGNGQHDRGQNGDGGHPVMAPEIDPASAGSALTLLLGGLAMIRGRRRPQ